MSNTNNPSGFLPYINPFSGQGQAKVAYLPLAAANSAIGVGTPVTLASGAAVNIAGTTDALCGMAAEAKAANSGGMIAVWADPQQWFVAQTDDGTGDLTASTDLGKNCTFVGTGVSNGRSTAEIDENSGSNTATLLLKTIRLSDEAGNAHGEFNRLVVKINNHQFGSHTGTAGQA